MKHVSSVFIVGPTAGKRQKGQDRQRYAIDFKRIVESVKIGQSNKKLAFRRDIYAQIKQKKFNDI